MTVDRSEFVLIMLDGDNLLHGCRVATKHHEVFAFDAHQVFHGFKLTAQPAIDTLEPTLVL